MKQFVITTQGKLIASISKLSNKGHGSTWPGHIALKLNKNFIKSTLHLSKTKVIFIVGTNGKTTTANILSTILKEGKKSVAKNASGANLLNGIASALLLHTNVLGRLTTDYAIIEVDENNLPLILKEITPAAIIALDLFRDQLDRYGELDSIIRKWHRSLTMLPPFTKLILNSDDPLISYLGKDSKLDVSYFGLNEITYNEKLQHASDSIYCPRCKSKLNFSKIYFSHLGDWNCPSCKLTRPAPHMSYTTYPLVGTYNKYNTLAAVLCAKRLGISEEVIEKGLLKVTPSFGRQEKMEIGGKKIQIFLAKNPTSFNETLRTISDLGAKNVLIALNDRIPDGRDVSWIWDVDFEDYIDKFKHISVSGDRVYDLALRLQYSQKSEIRNTISLSIEPNLQFAISKSLGLISSEDTLYILPTYSAMLDVRKILTGRKIL